MFIITWEYFWQAVEAFESTIYYSLFGLIYVYFETYLKNGKPAIILRNIETFFRLRDLQKRMTSRNGEQKLNYMLTILQNVNRKFPMAFGPFCTSNNFYADDYWRRILQEAAWWKFFYFRYEIVSNIYSANWWRLWYEFLCYVHSCPELYWYDYRRAENFWKLLYLLHYHQITADDVYNKLKLKFISQIYYDIVQHSKYIFEMFYLYFDNIKINVISK